MTGALLLSAYDKIVVLVGQHIKELRIKKGLSQEELAHRAELNTAHMGRIERGQKNCTLESIEKITRALDVPIEELFNYIIIPKEEKEREECPKCCCNLNAFPPVTTKFLAKVWRKAWIEVLLALFVIHNLLVDLENGNQVVYNIFGDKHLTHQSSLNSYVKRITSLSEFAWHLGQS
jgi:transcriptional regulator with XRE-family HTH domain